MIKVLQKGDKILEQKAEEISLDEVESTNIKDIISNMKEVLNNAKDAVALAAPQVGQSLRLFLMSKKVFKNDKAEDLIFINPKITKMSKDKEWVEEGCLSVKDIYGKVERYKKTTIRAHDEKGKIFTFGASGLLAQVFQHEIDHLDGILFTTKAKDLKKEENKNDK